MEKILVNLEVLAGGKAGVAGSDIIVRLTDDLVWKPKRNEFRDLARE
jgi:hypothetical protein